MNIDVDVTREDLEHKSPVKRALSRHFSCRIEVDSEHYWRRRGTDKNGDDWFSDWYRLPESLWHVSEPIKVSIKA